MSEHEDLGFSLPSLKNVRIEDIYDFQQQIVSIDDLQTMNTSLNTARVALFTVTKKISQIERREKLAETEYNRAYRRAYTESTAKTDTARKMYADIKCEPLEDTMIVLKQVKAELNRLSSTLRLEMETLKDIGNNLRQQMKVM